MKILAVDTTAKAASVCLAEEDKIIGSFFIDTALTHSRTLMPMLEALLDNTETKADELSAIAVNAGPGSFTGVRIGVAAVKGLAFAHNVPCVSVSTLESMAYNCIGGDCIVCAVMDARCSQVYNALFHVKGASVERLCDDRALALSDLKEELLRIDGNIVLVGDGASLSYAYLKDVVPNITLAPMNSRIQTASSTALAAFGSLSRGETLTPAELMPVYLRLPQAQRELNKRLSETPSAVIDHRVYTNIRREIHMIALGCDHGGFNLISAIKKHFDEQGIAYKDFGTYSEDSVDYPVYACKVANAVVGGECELGILCCGTGIGISMAANKIKGVRAAVVSNDFGAEMTRRHNHANILCMGGRVTSVEDALRYTDIFLNTPEEGGRHDKRVAMLTELDNGRTSFD